MEDSKKNVIKTLEFDNPNKIPTQLWDLPWAEIHYPNELQRIKRNVNGYIFLIIVIERCHHQMAGY